MGCYLNPGYRGFEESLNSAIYVDKTELLDKVNALIHTRQKYICVSRPRRFGKSMAADMIAAYYDRSCQTGELFQNLKISRMPSYHKHLNQYDVLKVNMQEFISITHNIEDMLEIFQKRLLAELKKDYSNYVTTEYLSFAMQDIYAHTGRSFIILIDEWDCLFREYQNDKDAQKKYLDFLRVWLKDKEYVALAYMTGILPIKKYGSHSALNMFTEYSMTNPREMSEFFGFTEEEVKKLCKAYNRSFEETKAWYDGYELVTIRDNTVKTCHMYSPKSVVDAMTTGIFDNYWNQTETYEALKIYIQLNFEGLKDAVITMLAGNRVPVNIGTFSNDMTTMQGKDDVLTLLVHLGYLSYRWRDKTVSIPNKEVSQEFINAISTMNWHEVMDSINTSRKLLQALWKMDAETVAEGIDKAHQEISILQYNDENSLSCAIHLAFYFAREYYTVVRELPAGKGFADVCFIPRQIYADKPAVIVELKWDKEAAGAIAQIKERHYADALKDYTGNLILAGINYDRKTKKHSCVIEKIDYSSQNRN